MKKRRETGGGQRGRAPFTLLLLCAACGDDGTGGATDGATDGTSTVASTTAIDPTAGTSTSSSPPSTSSSGESTDADVTTTGPTSSGTGVTTGPGEASSGSTGDAQGTLGCGEPSPDATNAWLPRTVDVGGATREYWVWLPEPYNPNRAYRVVYQFHGCAAGDNPQNNNPPVQDYSGADAIHVRGRAIGECWNLKGEGPDVLFFDAMVDAVESEWCADPRRRLATGYSSGAFLGHRLACDRGDVLRGIATIAGGVGPDPCVGNVAALLIHDSDDTTVNINTSEAARRVHLRRNNCDEEAPTTPVEPAPCEAYMGCDADYPVIWCETAGQDHSPQVELSAPAFWAFLSALEPVEPGR